MNQNRESDGLHQEIVGAARNCRSPFMWCSPIVTVPVASRADPEQMRNAYHVSLDLFTHESSMMCTVASNCLRDALHALLNGDRLLAEQVIASGDLLDHMRVAAEAQALDLLALQAPVASELRTIVGGLWIVADLQRMGALAVDVAKTGRRRHPAAAVPEGVRPVIERMGLLALDLADRAGTALRDRNVQQAILVASDDHLIDDMQREMLSILLAKNWNDGVQSAVDIALLCRYLERFADHAVAVVSRVVFEVTGEKTSRETPLALHGRRTW